jgi:hypothetical protein
MPPMSGISAWRQPPQKAYKADIAAVAATWAALAAERKTLLLLLSRFDPHPAQPSRWFDPGERKKATHPIRPSQSAKSSARCLP